MSVSSDAWIRSTLIEAYPRLVEFERARRPSRESYLRLLLASGFREIHTQTVLEVRKRYASFDVLKEEILARKGKSTLFELSDEELIHYCDLLKQKSRTHELVECDPWTIWLAKK